MKKHFPARTGFLSPLATTLVVLWSLGTGGAGAAWAQTSPALVCYSGKLAASLVSITQLGRCDVNLAKDGNRAAFSSCVAAAAAAVESRIRSADTAAGAGFLCPGTAAGLAVDGQRGWEWILAEAAVFQANPLPDLCVQKRAAGLTAYATRYLNCTAQVPIPAPATVATCTAKALATFSKLWGAAGPCATVPFLVVRAGVDSAIDAQAALIRVRCGDGVTAGLEQCDDANAVADDGCEADCRVSPRCGNGIRQTDRGEQCDDGNVRSGDGCDAACMLEVCGNGLVQVGEQCDAGSQTAACDGDCTWALCGDGRVNTLRGETCDTAGESKTCDGDCTTAVCGDGNHNAAAAEQCDDGNVVANDGCDQACRAEFCGDDRRQASEECDDANNVDGDGCSSGCLRETCGLVGAGVRCLVCAAGSSPDPLYHGCVCDAGFVRSGSVCRDIDECAAGTDACGASTPCVNVPGSYSCSIPCTDAAFEAALQSCGAPSRVITFDCTDTTIAIPDVGIGPRSNACSGLVIDGLDRNIAFEMTPKCWGRPAAASACKIALNADGTCDCPNIDSGTYFLQLRGDRMTVRNLTVRSFYDGIKTTGNDNTVESVTFDHNCDESMGNVAGAGNLYRDVWAKTGCGKCMQNYGNVAATSPQPLLRRHYNAIVRDSLFTDCEQPIRMTDGGRYRIEGTRMEGFFESGMFRCLGPRFDGGAASPLVVDMTDSEVEGCDRGVRIGGSAQATLWRNRLVGNGFRGLLAMNAARVSMWDNIVVGNGGIGSTEPGLGGVAIDGSARVDLGGGVLVLDGQTVSSPGGNTLCGNIAPNGSPREVHNLQTTVVRAENNWWCTVSPSSRVTGPVDFDPLLASAP